MISLGTIIFSISRFSSLNALAINSITVSGADSEIDGILSAAAYDALDGKYLGLFSKSNILIYPKKAIRESVEKISSRIESVSVSRGEDRTLNVSVTLKQAAALVCANLPDFSDDSTGCYLADSTGLIFKQFSASSTPFINKYYIPWISEKYGADGDAVGTFATSTELFLELQEIYSVIKEAGINLSGILVDKDGYELYVQDSNDDMETISPNDTSVTVIYMNNSETLANQTVNLISFWKNMMDDAKHNGVVKKFEYIDVRYGSNVFYRLIE
jgi:hypothetical protein